MASEAVRKGGLSDAFSVNLAGTRRTKGPKRNLLATRSATLQVRPRLFERFVPLASCIRGGERRQGNCLLCCLDKHIPHISRTSNDHRIEVPAPLGLCSSPRTHRPHRREDHPVDGPTTLRYCGPPLVSIPRITYEPCV